MSETTMPTTHNVVADASALPSERILYSDADYDAFFKWDMWYCGLRASLHGSVLEELATDGPLSVLDEFFDVYGLALERAYGLPTLVDFAREEPVRSGSLAADLCVSRLSDRIDNALSGGVIEYNAEELPTVARLLRARAANLTALAESIEQGKFEFPTEENRLSPKI